MHFLPGLLILPILSFFSFSAKRKEHTVALNRRLACTMLGGQCKNKCGEKEFRIIYCERPTTLCCMRECDSKK